MKEKTRRARKKKPQKKEKKTRAESQRLVAAQSAIAEVPSDKSSASSADRSSYNPDVLTCIANLSSDEVFTPPQPVNRMLDLLPPEL